MSAWEDRRHPILEASPLAVLLHLMEENALRQADLLDVFGSRNVASAVVNGKCEITKAQAKALAACFDVSVDVLI